VRVYNDCFYFLFAGVADGKGCGNDGKDVPYAVLRDG
jgi:hypothetical protein